jgi:hypothetical protein
LVFTEKKINKTMNKYSFQRGWSQVKQGEAAAVRSKLMSALSLNTRMAFYARLNGKVEPKVSEAQQIEAIFAAHGVKDVWGDAR